MVIVSIFIIIVSRPRNMDIIERQTFGSVLYDSTRILIIYHLSCSLGSQQQLRRRLRAERRARECVQVLYRRATFPVTRKVQRNHIIIIFYYSLVLPVPLLLSELTRVKRIYLQVKAVRDRITTATMTISGVQSIQSAPRGLSSSQTRDIGREIGTLQQ